MKKLVRKALVCCTIFTVMSFALGITSGAACPLTSLFTSGLTNGTGLTNTCSQNNSSCGGGSSILSVLNNNSGTSNCNSASVKSASTNSNRGKNSASKNNNRSNTNRNTNRNTGRNTNKNSTANTGSCNSTNSGCNISNILNSTNGGCNISSILGNYINNNNTNNSTCPTGTCPTSTCPTGTCPTNTCPTGNCDTTDCPNGNCDTTDEEFASYAEELLSYVNAARAQNGLSALKLNATLNEAAQIRAKETVSSFSHTRPNGTSFSTALKEVGLSYKSCGENIAYGYSNAKTVFEGWMSSAGHRANILNSGYTYMGIGKYNNNWSQLFMS